MDVYSYVEEIAEKRELVRDVVETPDFRPNHLLIVTLADVALDRTTDHLDEAWARLERQIAARIDDGQAGLERAAGVILGRLLLDRSPGVWLNTARELAPKAIADAHQHDYRLPLALDTAMAVAMVRKDDEEVRALRHRRVTTSGVYGGQLAAVETLYLSHLALNASPRLPTWGENGLITHAAIGEGVSITLAPLLALGAVADRNGKHLGNVLRGSVAAIERDLIPAGPKEGPRVACADPAWSVGQDDEQHPTLDCALDITGTGGPIVAVGAMIMPLVYGFPGAFEALLGGASLSRVRGLRSRRQLTDLLADPDAEVRAIARMPRALMPVADAIAPYRARYDVAVEWMRGLFPGFRCRANLVLEEV